MLRRLIALACTCTFLAACSSGGSGGGDGEVRELTLRQPVSGTIARVGEVDWYHLRAVEANDVLQVRCTSPTLRPVVDLLVTVFELDDQGNMVRLYGDHAAEGSQLPADLALNLYVDRPKDLYIAVRDLLDDEEDPDSVYQLSADFVGGADEDGNFAGAVPLDTAPGSAAVPGTIGHVGDVDCYSFAAHAAGVYRVDVDFQPFGGGTDVTLAVRLYDGEGALVAAHPGGYRNLYRLLCYLEAGTYYLLVEDAGRDDYDLSSTYTVGVSAEAVTEANGNDAVPSATPLAPDPTSGAYTAQGALDYLGDLDWYVLPDPGSPGTGIQVLKVSFADAGAEAGFLFHLALSDANGNVLLDRDCAAGSAPYRTQLQAGQGDHFLRVEPAGGSLLGASAPYELSVAVTEVDDPAEAGDGNDTINTAQPLASTSTPDSGWVEGIIAHRGDEDWFRVETDTTATRVLEVFLETDAAAPPEYALSILRDGLVRKVYDSVGEDGPVRLKASVLIPQGSPAGPATYAFKVCDFQGDEGSGGVPYRIRCNITAVPAALPADANVGSALYHDEAAEAPTPRVQLEHNALLKSEFPVDTESLAFRAAPPPAWVDIDTSAEPFTISFPWVGGYVDHQGDQDWFELDLGPLASDGVNLDAHWYYDVQVEFYTPGSAVEYVWKLYRDENQNRLLVDAIDDSNGFFASDGDPDTVPSGLVVTTPEPGSGEPFWVGDEWEGKFYLSVSDFQFLNTAESDADWGYDAPYYVKLTLFYHPGVSRPPR